MKYKEIQPMEKVRQRILDIGTEDEAIQQEEACLRHIKRIRSAVKEMYTVKDMHKDETFLTFILDSLDTSRENSEKHIQYLQGVKQGKIFREQVNV